MADIDYTIKKLTEQQRKVDQGDIEVWLNTTYSFIEDYFKSYSTRASTFRSLISDYKIEKIGNGFYGNHLTPTHFKNKALEYIKECLQYLNEQKDLKSKEIKTSKQSIKSINPVNKYSNSNRPKQEIRQNPKPQVVKTQLPYGIEPGLFWSIFAAIVAAAFFLGLHFGQTKFDKEKSDLYYENKQLKLELAKKTSKIQEQDKAIHLDSLKSDLTNRKQ